MRRRRWVAVGAAAAVLVAGAGGAYAYTNAGSAVIASPQGFFTFCADRQIDIAGITSGDLAGANNGGRSYTVENVSYPNVSPPASNVLSTTSAFVLGKSGILYDESATPLANPLNVRRVLVTTYVEYSDAGKANPIQVRCKMRTTESLNKPVTLKQKFDDNVTPSATPWGFGAGTASGPARTCQDAHTDLVNGVWNNALSPAQRDAAPYRVAASAAGAANVVVDASDPALTGTQWTAPYKGAVVQGADLHIGSRSLDSPTDSGAPNDRLRGAYYCTFLAPDYLKAIFLGTVVPPTGTHL